MSDLQGGGKGPARGRDGREGASAQSKFYEQQMKEQAMAAAQANQAAMRAMKGKDFGAGSFGKDAGGPPGYPAPPSNGKMGHDPYRGAGGGGVKGGDVTPTMPGMSGYGGGPSGYGGKENGMMKGYGKGTDGSAPPEPDMYGLNDFALLGDAPPPPEDGFLESMATEHGDGAGGNQAADKLPVSAMRPPPNARAEKGV